MYNSIFEQPAWDNEGHPKNSLESCAHTRMRLLYGAREAITM